MFLLEPPTPCLLEGVNGYLYAYLPLERHTYDVLQVDKEAAMHFPESYISSLQQEINTACAGGATICEDLWYWPPYI
jgi:hypothetical protein